MIRTVVVSQKNIKNMSLTVNKITKLYGKQKALDNISFEIKTGEIVGFLGPNGAGKSTMMKIIVGYISQTSGEVSVNGLNTLGNIIKIRKQIGYLPEHNPLYLNMYVKEYLNFVAGIYKLGINTHTRVNEIIELTGLTLERKKKISMLSKGYRQRIGLAAALIHDPDVLILDEPTTGLDPNQIIEIRDLILKIGKEKTIMLSTHIMQEVEAICSRVIIIDEGKIVTDNLVKQISEINQEKEQTIFVEFEKDIEKNEINTIDGLLESVELSDKLWALKSKDDNDIRRNVFDFAVKNKNRIISMYKEEKSMEDIFRELTNRNDN